MAYPWACDFNPHLQMESRIKRRGLSLIVAIAMIASTSTAFAATSTPTPKPSVKATAKATPKPTPKPTKKPVVKKKPAAKKPSPKKVIYKRKVVKVTPSPAPKWPPRGFIHPSNSEIYYKIPKADELRGVLSAIAALATQIRPCTKSACGVVTVASTNGCTWWEIDSKVYGPLSATDSSLVPYGNLSTTAKATNAKQITTVLLISTEPLKPNVSVGNLEIYCHHDPVTTATQKVPSNIYKINTPTPTPSDTPTTNTN